LGSDFSTRLATPTWDKLEEATGLSRPMIKRGLSVASAKGLLTVDASTYRHTYRLITQQSDTGFVKLPTQRLRAALSKLPSRGTHALDSLKIYIVLLRLMQRNSFDVSISHQKLIAWTGVKANRVRAGIDVLINHRLIHVTTSESPESGHPHNVYQLLGFSLRDSTTDGTGKKEQGNPSFFRTATSVDLV
jgi:hypothetical protein